MAVRYVKEFDHPRSFGFTGSATVPKGHAYARGGHVKASRGEVKSGHAVSHGSPKPEGKGGDIKHGAAGSGNVHYHAKGGHAHSDVAEDKALIKREVKPSALKKAHGGSVKHKYAKGGKVKMDRREFGEDREDERVSKEDESDGVQKRAKGGKVTRVPFAKGGKAIEFTFKKGGRVWKARPHDEGAESSDTASNEAVDERTAKGVLESSKPFHPDAEHYSGREHFALGGHMPKGGPGLGHPHKPKGAGGMKAPGGRGLGALGMAAGPLMAGLGTPPGGAAGAPAPMGGPMGAPPGAPPGMPMGGRPPMAPPMGARPPMGPPMGMRPPGM